MCPHVTAACSLGGFQMRFATYDLPITTHHDLSVLYDWLHLKKRAPYLLHELLSCVNFQTLKQNFFPRSNSAPRSNILGVNLV